MRRVINFKFGTWYMEYHSGIRITNYFSIFINNFPLFAFVKFDDPHSDKMWVTFTFGIFGFCWNFTTIED